MKRKFRIGTTSYIYPDHILPNVRKLKDKVEDIELVLFEASGDGNIPDKKLILQLTKIAQAKDLTYTVHLPLDIELGSADKIIRAKSVTKAIELINYMAELNPFAYILHLNLSHQAQRFICQWQKRVNNSLTKLLAEIKIPSRHIAVENLNYHYSLVDDLVAKNNMSVCIDIGHLIMTETQVIEHLRRYLPRTRVIHWHGVKDGKDHVSLEHSDYKQGREIIRLFNKSNYRGVVTLEVFSQNDLNGSLQVLKEWI